MEKHSLLEHALAYLKAGASVFPVGKDKRPLIPSWIEYQKRRATEDEVKEWWKTWQDANIAIVTGEISGVTVVDCDLGSDHTQFPPTDTVQTGSGGYHLYYAYYPIGNKAGVYPHVDIRGDGGYVVAAPSVTEDTEKKKGGKYIFKIKAGRQSFPAHLFGEQKKSRIDEILRLGSDDGTRNNDLTTIAGSLLSRYPEREWQTKVWPMFQTWNQMNVRPPKSLHELTTIFKSIAGAERSKRVKGSVGETAIEHIGDAVRVTLPIDGGFAVFEFSDFDFNARTQDCTLLCHIEDERGQTRKLTSRINLLSMSGRSEFLRQFKDSFDIQKKSPWPAVLSEIFTSVAQTKSAKYKAQKWSEITVSPWGYVFEPYVISNVPNALFGKGGTGKTFLALRIAISVAFGVPMATTKAPPIKKNVMFLDFEDDSGEFKDRITKLVKGLPPDVIQPTEQEIENSLFYFDSAGLPFVNLLEPLKKAVNEHNIGLIIIDSAAKACGGKVEDSETTNKFFNSLKSLGITSLIIAHESKNAQDDNDFIFGSSFWNYSFRNVWKAKTEREKDDNVIHTGLVHCKTNRGKLQKTRAYRVYFGEDFVEVNYENPTELFARETPMRDQVMNAIFQGVHTVKEIAEFTDKDVAAVKLVLNRQLKGGKIVNKTGGGRGVESQWFLPDGEGGQFDGSKKGDTV